MAEIKFENVSKSFGKTTVIENMNLTLPDGKFTVLLGPSGCGKTTLLRMIAGIGPESSGTVYMNGKDLKNVPPGERDIAMVFQSYALYPTMSVRENIEFCLKNNKIPKAERKKRVEAVAKRVDLTDYLDRKPSQLSGGQRQRVALARAMVKEPQVFLMDEPLSNLDAKLRASMRSELIQLHNKLKTTFIYVTHDQIESMAMADYIVLLNHGKIMQQDTPEEIYNNPANVFTAQFIGTLLLIYCLCIMAAMDSDQRKLTLFPKMLQILNNIGKRELFSQEKCSVLKFIIRFKQAIILL